MIQLDSSGQYYVDIYNKYYRLTYIKKDQRNDDANWAGKDAIRIQAYKGKGDALHPGPEIVIDTEKDIYELISSLCHLIDTARTGN
jgi:hypothetical protein